MKFKSKCHLNMLTDDAVNITWSWSVSMSIAFRSMRSRPPRAFGRVGMGRASVTSSCREYTVAPAISAYQWWTWSLCSYNNTMCSFSFSPLNHQVQTDDLSLKRVVHGPSCSVPLVLLMLPRFSLLILISTTYHNFVVRYSWFRLGEMMSITWSVILDTSATRTHVLLLWLFSCSSWNFLIASICFIISIF